ncbi:rhomboid-related protein 4-like [Saccostrea cucullata]|uniref:rhomboid-related protein 4-like n=1 Tax=Saccostrea cuccullata TaxID=36930 RepID=UPI002ED36191
MFNNTLCDVTYLVSEGRSGLSDKVSECLSSFQHIPYITAAFVCVLFCCYYNRDRRSGGKDVWVSPVAVFDDGEYHRLLFGPFHHMDEGHLTLNLALFAVKSAILEQIYKPGYLLYMIIVFTFLSSLFCIFLRILAAVFYKDVDNYNKSLVRGCVGISGVIFALKVLISDFTKVDEFVYWIELIVVHITSPGTCFTSHLGGILVGVLYKYTFLQRLMYFGGLDEIALRSYGA